MATRFSLKRLRPTLQQQKIRVSCDIVLLYWLNGIPYGSRWLSQCRVCKTLLYRIYVKLYANVELLLSWPVVMSKLLHDLYSSQVVFRWPNQNKLDGRGEQHIGGGDKDKKGLARNPKWLLGRHRRRWNDNIKMDYNDVGWRRGWNGLTSRKIGKKWWGRVNYGQGIWPD
jgi:hypothetical protein